MFNAWTIVRPNVWGPLAALEQSMMDLERMHDVMMSSYFPLSNHRLLAVPDDEEEEEFFKDLPVSSAEEAQKVNKRGKSKKHEKHEKHEKKGQRAFSSYSYSSSSVINENGERVETTRRRYEDSNGRLKAQHVRKIGDKACMTSWNRHKKGEEGEHKTHINEGSIEEFEKLWEATAFGTAIKQHQIEAEQKPKKGQEDYTAKVRPANMPESKETCSSPCKCKCAGDCTCGDESPTKKRCMETCQSGGKGACGNCPSNCPKQGTKAPGEKNAESPKKTSCPCECSKCSCRDGCKSAQPAH